MKLAGYRKPVLLAIVTEGALLCLALIAFVAPMDYHHILPTLLFVFTHPMLLPTMWVWPSCPGVAAIAAAILANASILTLLCHPLCTVGGDSASPPGKPGRAVAARLPPLLGVGLLAALVALDVVSAKDLARQHAVEMSRVEELCGDAKIFSRLAEGGEQDLPTLVEVKDVDESVEVIYTSTDRSVFLTVVGDTLEAYASWRCLKNRWVPPDGLPQELAGLRGRLAGRDVHQVSIARSRLGHDGSWLYFVNGRLWYRREWELKFLAREELETLKSREGTPLALAVAGPGSRGPEISGGHDVGVVAGARYEVLRDGKRVAVIEILEVLARSSAAKVVELIELPKPGDPVRKLPEETGDARGDPGAGD